MAIIDKSFTYVLSKIISQVFWIREQAIEVFLVIHSGPYWKSKRLNLLSDSIENQIKATLVLFMDLGIHFKFLMLTPETIVPPKMSDVYRRIGCSVYWFALPQSCIESMKSWLFCYAQPQQSMGFPGSAVHMHSYHQLRQFWPLYGVLEDSVPMRIKHTCYVTSAFPSQSSCLSSLVAVGDGITRYNSREVA